ncbi:MAG TPA: hypothetical protein VLZ74_02535, partial [Methylocella sp.]|nr:hypothetical protein [Methylocella sp.]
HHAALSLELTIRWNHEMQINTKTFNAKSSILRPFQNAMCADFFTGIHEFCSKPSPLKNNPFFFAKMTCRIAA